MLIATALVTLIAMLFRDVFSHKIFRCGFLLEKDFELKKGIKWIGISVLVSLLTVSVMWLIGRFIIIWIPVPKIVGIIIRCVTYILIVSLMVWCLQKKISKRSEKLYISLKGAMSYIALKSAVAGTMVQIFHADGDLLNNAIYAVLGGLVFAFVSISYVEIARKIRRSKCKKGNNTVLVDIMTAAVMGFVFMGLWGIG